MRRSMVLASLVVVAGVAHAQSPCKLEGVWQLVSGTEDGKPYPAGSREIKIITKTHFVFLFSDPSGPKATRTVADSLAVARANSGGGGTYTLSGTTYTEKLDFFPDPAYIGKSVSFTCRTEGDRFYQSGLFPVFEGGRKVRDSKLEEVWRRIE